MVKQKGRYIDFREIKKHVSIEDVLTHYGVLSTLKGTSDQRKGACPIHGGSNKSTSFSVNFSKDCWNCFGECDSGGNILDFVAAMESCSIRDAALKIADWFGLQSEPVDKNYAAPGSKGHESRQPPTKKTTEAVSQSDRGVGTTADDDQASSARNEPLPFQVLKSIEHDHEEVINRGVKSDTAEHFGVGYCTRGSLKGRVVIPIHDTNGSTLAYTGTALEGEPEPYIYHANYIRGLEVYNVHRAVMSERISQYGYIVVTDYLHVLDLYENGIDNVMALVDPKVSSRQLDTLAALPLSRRSFTLTVRSDDKNAERIAGAIARIGYVHIATISSLALPGRKNDEFAHELKMDVGS